jgi:hypothetical protein
MAIRWVRRGERTMMRMGGSKPGLLLLIVADLSSRYIGLANVICCFVKLAKSIL